MYQGRIYSFSGHLSGLIEGDTIGVPMCAARSRYVGSMGISMSLLGEIFAAAAAG